MDILYTTHSDAGAVFAERRLAEHVAPIYEALMHSTTWREFAAAMPADEYVKALEENGLEPEEVDLDAPFDPHTVLGYADGTYPTWLQAEAVKWFPEDLIDKYDAYCLSTHEGEFLYFPEEAADQIAAELASRGHTVTRSNRYFL